MKIYRFTYEREKWDDEYRKIVVREFEVERETKKTYVIKDYAYRYRINKGNLNVLKGDYCKVYYSLSKDRKKYIESLKQDKLEQINCAKNNLERLEKEYANMKGLN